MDTTKNNKTKKIHLTVNNLLHKRLKDIAQHRKMKLAVFVREALERQLKQEEREKRRQEIAEFAETYANTEFDMDKDVEELGVDFMLNQNEEE